MGKNIFTSANFLGGEVRGDLIRLGIQGPHVWVPTLSLWNHSYLPKKKPQIKSLFQGFIAIKYPFIGSNWPYFLGVPIGCVVRVARIPIRSFLILLSLQTLQSSSSFFGGGKD